MLILTAESFSPSEVLVRLLYSHLTIKLPVDVQSGINTYTKDQIRYGFAHTLYSIRHRDVCKNISDRIFWLVNEDGKLRDELFSELKSRLDLHHAADFNDTFKMRLAEEIMHWALLNPKEAERNNLCRLQCEGKHCIALVRKDEVDSTVGA